MRFSSRFRTAFFALAALAGVGLVAVPAAFADGGSIGFNVIKGGWFIGGQGGHGVLHFHGRSYPITIGGISAGLLFGGSETRFRGTVDHIRSPGDVAGVYAAAGAGGALGPGAQVIVLTNEKGARLRLTGHQIGAQINADISGLVITLR